MTHIKNPTMLYITYLISLCKDEGQKQPWHTSYCLILTIFRYEFLSTLLLISSTSLSFDFGHISEGFCPIHPKAHRFDFLSIYTYFRYTLKYLFRPRTLNISFVFKYYYKTD